MAAAAPCRLETLANRWLLHASQKHAPMLAALRGLRNGLIYGVKIRAPHALVMVALFGTGSLPERLRAILQMTKQHALNLGRFVFGYKALMAALARWTGMQSRSHAFVAAAIVGYTVFGEENGVNTQINLYLLSRVLYGLAKLSVDNGYVRGPPFAAFPWFAALVWGAVLWLFEHHRDVLQKSLLSSMTYLYRDSNQWTDARDYLFG